MNSKGKWIALIIIAIAVVVAVAGRRTDKVATDVAKTPVKIGFVGPLTGAGAAYGADTINAARIAEKEINDAGGINGRQIQIISEDGMCSAKDGLNAAQKLINVDGVKYIVSGSCSGELLGYTSLADQTKTLVINSLASAPKVSHVSEYVFRNAPSDADGGKQLANLVAQKFKKVAVITEDTEYAHGIREVFNDTFKAAKGTIVVDEKFGPNTTDFKTILLKVKNAAPEAIFLNVQEPANGARLAKQARDLGLKSQFYLAYMSGPEYAASGPAVEGSYIVDVPGLYQDKGASLLAKFKNAYGREPNYPYFVGSTYDAVYIMADAIKSAGDDTTKAKEYVAAITEYSGTVGNYHFDANHDVVGVQFVVRQVKNQKTVEITQ